MPTYLNIPVSICRYSLSKNRIAEFQLFCWFKTQCSGHFKLNNALLYKTYKNLGTTKETVLKRIHWLLKNKWMGYNSKSKNYHLNSFKIIHKRTKNESFTGAVWDDYKFKDFEAFVYAVVLFDIARKKRWYEKKLAKEKGRLALVGMKKGRSRKSRSTRPFSLPLSYAAKVLKIDQRTISRKKKDAQKAKFLFAKNKFKKIGIPYEEKSVAKKYGENSHKIVIRNQTLYEQLPDEIDFFIHLKKKSNLRQIKPIKCHRI